MPTPKPPANPLEGDFLQTAERVIFAVKGHLHPRGRVVAYPKYYPSIRGEREAGGARYRKLQGLQASLAFLKRRLPRYLEYAPDLDAVVGLVPKGRIARYYSPRARLRELLAGAAEDVVAGEALEFIGAVKKEAGVGWSRLGVSGSLLVGLQREGSDLDLVVYGSETSRRVHRALRRLIGPDGKQPFRPLNLEELKALFAARRRDTPMPFKAFAACEARKALLGAFRGRAYSVRLVKTPEELEERPGRVAYRNLGRLAIKATVEDDRDAIFTPCRYRIKDVRVLEGRSAARPVEVASFRLRFCEQARAGEEVCARGKLEEVLTPRGSYLRLLVGGSPDDVLAPRAHLKGCA